MLKFKHDEEKLHRAFGLSDQVKDLIREKILFCTFSNILVRDELFDDKDDAPAELTSITGILEKALGLATEQEHDYMLLTFNDTHDMGHKALVHYKMINNNDTSKEARTKAKLLELLAGLKELDIYDSNSEIRSLVPSNFIKRIKMVKKSGYNFDKYIELIADIME
jgi:hypothetical protein